MTHYLRDVAARTRGPQLAVCGRHIFLEEHAVNPSCPKCRAWLEADEAEAKELGAKWTAEDHAKRAAMKAGT